MLYLLRGRVQRLPDTAMLTQGSQGVCYRYDTEWRAELPDMSPSIIQSGLAVTGSVFYTPRNDDFLAGAPAF